MVCYFKVTISKNVLGRAYKPHLFQGSLAYMYVASTPNLENILDHCTAAQRKLLEQTQGLAANVCTGAMDHRTLTFDDRRTWVGSHCSHVKYDTRSCYFINLQN